MLQIRKAKIADVADIQKLVNYFADRGEMLPRSLNTLYENIRDFFVAERDGKVLGCAALHIAWGDLAEIKSLAVDTNAQRSGIGKLLVKSCLDEAKALGIIKVFALTYKPEFFRRQGFLDIEKGELPHKIWSECINCPKFPDCGEEALQIELN